MVTRIGIGMKWENGREQAEQQDLDNQDARWGTAGIPASSTCSHYRESPN